MQEMNQLILKYMKIKKRELNRDIIWQTFDKVNKDNDAICILNEFVDY